MASYKLATADEIKARYPKKFNIPLVGRQSLAINSIVKVSLITGNRFCPEEEIMVMIDERTPTGYLGTIYDYPCQCPGLTYLDRIEFEPQHIIGIHSEDEIDYGLIQGMLQYDDPFCHQR